MRHGKLSSQEFALSQLASNRHASCQDEGDEASRGPGHNIDKRPIADSRFVRGQSRAPMKRSSDQNTNRNPKKPIVEMGPPLGRVHTC